MIHLDGMISARMFTLSLSQPHALSVPSKACFKQCQVMSHLLYLCMSENQHDYGTTRWTTYRPSCDKSMTNCCMRGVLGVSWSWWRRTHCVCHTCWCQDWVSCINSLLDAPPTHVCHERVLWRPRDLVLQFSVRFGSMQGVYDEQWRLAAVAIR